jgi:hypothetical protein
MHPLVEDLSKLKDAEIEARIQSLGKKYWIAGNNPGIQVQISTILQMYQEELSARRAKMWEQQYQKRDKGLDDLIKVN